MNNQLKHLAIIVDGNRRYARKINEEPWKGHDKGAEKIEELLEWSRELNIREVTIYALSTENLKRDKKELEHLFTLFKKFFKKFKKNKEVHKNKIKISFIGNLSLVPKNIKNLAEEIIKETKDYENYKLNFCFAYGGRLELTTAVNKLIKKGKRINEKDITNALWLNSEPDLIIRTGDNVRTSNFLPWQSVYSEWIFLKKMWPEFTKQDLLDCLKKFNKIKRNFGR